MISGNKMAMVCIGNIGNTKRADKRLSDTLCVLFLPEKQLGGLTGATLLTALCGGFPFATSLWTLVMSPASSFGKDTILLHFTVEFFEGDLERVAGVYFYFAHGVTSAICDR